MSKLSLATETFVKSWEKWSSVMGTISVFILSVFSVKGLKVDWVIKEESVGLFDRIFYGFVLGIIFLYLILKLRSLVLGRKASAKS